MDKKEIEIKLAGVMDAVPECEGLIYAKTDGQVIVGQTLTEMDHSGIAKEAAAIIKTQIGKPLKKGALKEITIGLEKGFLIIMIKADKIFLGLLGTDGKNSVGLLARQLKVLIDGM